MMNLKDYYYYYKAFIMRSTKNTALTKEQLLKWSISVEYFLSDDFFVRIYVIFGTILRKINILAITV